MKTNSSHEQLHQLPQNNLLDTKRKWLANISPEKTLAASAAFWFGLALIGQIVFTIYICAFYGGAVLANDWARWNKILAVGYIEGDRVHNFALATHLVIAAIITLSGAIQLLPKIRKTFPRFHHWNGRFYVCAAIITSFAGTYMIWTRTMPSDFTQNLGTTFNAILIVLFALTALFYAIKGKIAIHRPWALRLFLAVSGTWFFRVGLFFWLIVNHGPVGFNPKTFQGPFLSILVFAQTLLPLALLEMYLRAQSSTSPRRKILAATVIAIFSITMAIGIAGASMGLWLPRL